MPELPPYVRIPRQIVEWRVWAMEPECFVLYLTLIILALDPERPAPAVGMVSGTSADFAARALISAREAARAMSMLEQHGYIRRVDEPAETWAVAHHEMFDPTRPAPEPFDPASRR